MTPEVRKRVEAARAKLQAAIEEMSCADPDAPVGLISGWALIVHEVVFVGEPSEEDGSAERSLYWMDYANGRQPPHVTYGLLSAALERVNIGKATDDD